MSASKGARDEALDAVSDRPKRSGWWDRAMRLLPDVFWPYPGWDELTGEDIRHRIEPIIGPPHHHNVWGSFINSAQQDGIIVKTEERRFMRDVKSHARATDVYALVKPRSLAKRRA